MLKHIIILPICLIATLAFAAGDTPMRYVALGDSYTIGTGAQPGESWPSLITAHLQNKGFPIELAGNLGRNGWTSQNLIDWELPPLKGLRPDYVTVLIGANDWVQGVKPQTFQAHLEIILDELLKMLPSHHILVMTIPNFSVTPIARKLSHGTDIAGGIQKFNRIIIDEAQKRGLKTADLYPLSTMMGQDPTLVAPDGLHPTAREYARWARLIGPAFESLLPGK